MCYYRFWDNARFPGVAEAIDGTHIVLWPSQKERETFTPIGKF